ncbi:NADP-dependent oxidoreductase [Kribbella sp.]|uniref:NADP-dependent oxidoreductase n=1 Tax=Kribbella sp. TaxID=1871183 RepID=UPI002D4667FB|nr:NADP-dependent oxidoreductase [Kribbella sp.]HZX03620.1 NADP-dependent oxidoreductase [Kribbella sp.]
MRAYVLTRYGDARAMEFRDVPDPTPGDEEVLIRVRAAGLNPVDYKIREGKLRLINRLRLPIVAGSELSGVVEGVGPGVSRFAVGDRVFSRVDKHKLGAYAPYATVHQSIVAKMPATLDFAAAAGLPLAGLTALQALRDELAVKAGDNVFISGGAGGVGTLAIQLAAWMGANVATTASPRGADLVRSLGAGTVIDYRSERFKDLLSGYDGAFDLTGGQDLIDSFDILRRGSRTVSIAGMPDATTARLDLDAGPLLTAALAVASAKIHLQARRRGVGYRYLFMHPSGADLDVLADLVDKGHLRPLIDRVFPFADLAAAFTHLEQGHAKGKVVVQL